MKEGLLISAIVYAYALLTAYTIDWANTSAFNIFIIIVQIVCSAVTVSFLLLHWFSRK